MCWMKNIWIGSNTLPCLDFKNRVTRQIKETSCRIQVLFFFKPTLEELGVTKNKVNFVNLLELRSLPKLKVLNCKHLSSRDIEDLKSELPHVVMNQNGIKIATSYKSFEPRDGFWEIVVKQLQCFENQYKSESENFE